MAESPQEVDENLMSPKARQNNPPSFWGKEDFMVHIIDEMYDSLKKVVKYILQNVIALPVQSSGGVRDALLFATQSSQPILIANQVTLIADLRILRQKFLCFCA